MTEKELFLFDLNGFVVIEGALTPEEVAAGNAAIDHHQGLIRKRDPGLSEGAVNLAAASGRGEFTHRKHESPVTHQSAYRSIG